MGNPIDQLPEIIGTIRQAAEEAGRGDTRFDIGFHGGIIYLGQPPEGTQATLTGSPQEVADHLRRAAEAGANVLHLRFANRSKEELLDQMAAFGAEVAPLLP
jgi:alkanesulfonate monooxygenase SsuD/methylene tetrahydromethanopterin reductase-like flavin-dependent oxidoreductase (luciferase family)